MATEPLPGLPPSFPNISGPAFSFSQTRKKLDAAANTIDDLAAKVKKDILGNLMSAAREGARLETKALKPIGGKLQAAQQLLDGLGSLVSDDIVGKLAQAVAAVEDYSAREVSAVSLGESPSAGPFRATTPADVVPGPSALVRRGAIIPATDSAGGGPLPPLESVRYTLAPGQASLPPPGPADQPQCPIPSQADQQRFQALGQQVADATPPSDNDRIIGIVGNWWALTDDCCTLGPARTQGDPSIQPRQPHWYLAITAPPDQAIAGFEAVKKAWNAHNIACGTPPVDCKAHPEDPRCPPPPPPIDNCPTNPCQIVVTCPPPVINVPPCPPVNFDFPSCVTIDLCDWEKFCKTLTDCLVKSKEDCALDNDTAYVYKDCDGSFGEALDQWWGDAGASVAEPQTYDDLIAAASQRVGNFSDTDFMGPDPFLRVT